MRCALKIAHLDTGRVLRGGQEQLLLLARGLKGHGHEQLVICPEGSPLEKRARHEGLKLFTLPPYDPGHVHGILQLRQLLLSEPFECLHAHDSRAQTISWLASLGTRVCRIANRNVTFRPQHPRLHRLQYDLTCHGVIAVSQSVRQVLVSSGVPEGKIEVITPGIEIPPESPGTGLRAKIRAHWGFSENEFVVGHIGAFTPEKGQAIALEATVLLGKALPSARLLLAGEGPTRNSPLIKAKVRQAGDRARLLGYVKDLTEFFAGLDLYIMPSSAEAWGVSALQAMAHGLAVVASRVGGLSEMVEEGKTGWLVPPSSPSALASAIALAASDSRRLAEFGANARERARLFSSDLTLARTEAFYYRLLGVGTGTPRCR